MSGRDEESITADSLTMDELRIIALYLSNFYIPFGTSLDGAESRDTSKENCKTALINLGFDKDLAEEIVEMVMAASLSSASQLYMDVDELERYNFELLHAINEDAYVKHGGEYCCHIGASNPNGLEAYLPLEAIGLGSDGTLPGVYFKGEHVTDEYLSLLNSSWSDGSDFPLTLWLWHILMNTSTNGYGVSRTLPVYYINSDNETSKVFQFDEYSAALWHAIMRNADYSNGMCGNALYNDTDIQNIYTQSDSEILARTIFTQPMYVDWVGNIICDCGDERVIVLPACMNPRTFSIADTTINIDIDILDIHASGEGYIPYTFNAVSTFGMSILQDTRLYRLEEGGIVKVSVPADHRVILPSYTIKSTRGSRKDASWDTILGRAGEEDDGAKLLKNLLNDLGVSASGLNLSGLADDDDIWAGFSTDRRIIVSSLLGVKTDLDPDSVGSYNYPRLTIENTVTRDLAYFNSEVSRVVTTNSFETVDVFALLAGNGETKISPFADSGKFNDITGNSYHNFINFSSPVDLRVLKSIFVTYTFAYCNAFPPARADAEFSGFTVNMKFNDIFPKVEGYLQFNHNFEERQSNERAEQVLGEIYWLLHPLKGIGYASTLFKRKIGGILVSWHEDIVGSTSSNYTTGSTHYLGSSLMMHIKPHR